MLMIRRTMLTVMTLITFCMFTAHAAEHTVKMLSAGANGKMMVMEPGFIKIAKGDVVNFVPSDASHNAQSVASPSKKSAFNTPMGKPTKITFSEEGVYLYKCLPHLALGMIGVVQVGKATNLTAVKTAAKTLSASIAMNKERVDLYLKQVK